MSVVQIRDEGPNWATKALVDFLSPLISNAIQQQQQRDANRKNNAFLGEFAKLMSGGQQPTNLLAEQGTEGWANALSQSGNSVLGEFDNATAGIAPQAPTQANFTQPQMTQTDFLRNFADLISGKRFSGMNTADALNLVAPLMNASEAQRVHELQKELGLELGQKGSWDDYLKAYANGVNQGLANLDTLKTMIGYAQSRQPYYQFSEMDTGDSKHYIASNPATGDAMSVLSRGIGVSPNTSATLKMQKYGIDKNAEILHERNDIERTENNQNYDIKDRTTKIAEENAAYERDNPELKEVYGEDGSVYYVNPRTAKVHALITPEGKILKGRKTEELKVLQDNEGNFIVIDPSARAAEPILNPDGSQAKGTLKSNSANKDITQKEKLEYETLAKEAQDLRKQQEKLQKQKNVFEDTPNDPMYKNSVAELERIENRLEQIRIRQNEILDGKPAYKQQPTTQAKIKSNAASQDIRAQTPQNTSGNQTSLIPPVTGSNDIIAQPNTTQKPNSPKLFTRINSDEEQYLTNDTLQKWYEHADAGDLKHLGINSRADVIPYLQKQGFTAQNANIQPQFTSPDKIPAPASTDITNHTTSADQKAEIDKLNGDIVSADVPAKTSQDKTMATPAPRKKGDKLAVNLPDAIYYNPDIDKNIAQEKILSMEDFKSLFGALLGSPRLAHLSPEQILQKVISQGYRIKRKSV